MIALKYFNTTKNTTDNAPLIRLWYSKLWPTRSPVGGRRYFTRADCLHFQGRGEYDCMELREAQQGSTKKMAAVALCVRSTKGKGVQQIHDNGVFVISCLWDTHHLTVSDLVTA
jgi:hypothetical protein